MACVSFYGNVIKLAPYQWIDVIVTIIITTQHLMLVWAIEM